MWCRTVAAFALGSMLFAGQAHAAAPQNVPESVIYSFKGGADGAYPVDLIFGPAGAFYGETHNSNSNIIGGADTVYELDPPASGRAAWTKKTLYTFYYGSSGGSDEHRVLPVGALVRDAAGNLYGTTESENLVNLYGTVFRLSPPASGRTQWTYSTLYNFTSPDGTQSGGGLVIGADGALYGGRRGGGDGGSGSLFKLTPPASAAGSWSKTTIYGFGSGVGPTGQMLLDPTGALYGYASFGYWGGVFKVLPPALGHAQWTGQTLYTFSGGADGRTPMGGLVADRTGALYGTTDYGGAGDWGAVFKLTPPHSGQAAWSESVIYDFRGLYDGAYPATGLAIDAQGFLYGVTEAGGGAFDAGTVFRLDPPYQTRKTWQFAVLHGFTANRVPGRPDEFGGASPLLATAGSAGRTVLFGLSEQGGTAGLAMDGSGAGAIYEVAP